MGKKPATDETIQGSLALLQFLIETQDALSPGDSKELTNDDLMAQFKLTASALRERIRCIDRLMLGFRTKSDRIVIIPIPRHGAPSKQQLARRRACIFELLLEKKLHLEGGSNTAICKLGVDEVVGNHLVTDREAAQKDFDAIFDFAHSMRLNEETIEAGTYAFSKYLNRENRNVDLKQEIAKEVANLVPSSTSIAVTEGSTTALCVEAILRCHKHVAITTNNLLLCQPGALEHCDVFYCGGDYHSSSHCTTGPRAAKEFRRRPCQFALISAYSIDSNGAAYVYHHQDCVVQQAAIESCERVIIACDATKLAKPGKWSFVNVFELASRKPASVVVVTNDPKDVKRFTTKEECEEANSLVVQLCGDNRVKVVYQKR